MSRRNKITSIGLHTLLTILAIVWLIPVFWLILSSFRAEKGAYTSSLWPQKFTIDNYIRLFVDTNCHHGNHPSSLQISNAVKYTNVEKHTVVKLP